jgi:hypothetical protein
VRDRSFRDCARFARRAIADRAAEFKRRTSRIAVRALSDEEFKEEDPEGLDIGSGGQALTAHLFGAGVAGGQKYHRHGHIVCRRLDDASEAEVEQLG